MYMGNAQRLVAAGSFVIALKMDDGHCQLWVATGMESFDLGPGDDSSSHLLGLRDKIRSNYTEIQKKCTIIVL